MSPTSHPHWGVFNASDIAEMRHQLSEQSAPTDGTLERERRAVEIIHQFKKRRFHEASSENVAALLPSLRKDALVLEEELDAADDLVAAVLRTALRDVEDCPAERTLYSWLNDVMVRIWRVGISRH